MNSDKHDSYLILSPEINTTSQEGQILEEFLVELNENFPTFKNMNLILDFSKVINTDVSKILLFSQLSGKQKQQNQSFVIVSKGIQIDNIPEGLEVVPTLQEAIDIIEIENIERDLGI